MRTTFVHRLLAAALASALFSTSVPPAQAALIEQTTPPTRTTPAVLRAPAFQPTTARTAADLVCDNSPFGSSIIIGADRELNLSYLANQSGFPIRYEQFDATATGLQRNVNHTGPTGARELTGGAYNANNDLAADYALVYVDSAGALQRITYNQNGASAAQRLGTASNVSRIALAEFPFGRLSTNINLAYRSNANSLRLDQYDLQGSLNSNGFFDQRAPRGSPDEIRVVSADLRKRGFAGERAILYRGSGGSARLGIFSLQDGANSNGSGFNFSNMQSLLQTDLELGIGTPQSIHLATGDVDGDFFPEIIVAQEQDTLGTELSNGIAVVVYKVNTLTPSFTLRQYASLNLSDPTLGMGLAAADTDRDGRAEVVLAYQRAGRDQAGNQEDVRAGRLLRTYDIALQTDTAQFVPHNTKLWPQNLSTNFAMSLAADDMDRDGLADIAIVASDGTKMTVQRIEDSVVPGAGFTELNTVTETDTPRARAAQLKLAFADVDGDSVLATYNPSSNVPLCATVTEPQITAAVFTPPYWADIQANQDKYGSIGEYRSQSTTDTNEISTRYSHSVSGYVGFEVDGEVVEVAARVTGGYSWETATGSSASVSQGTTQSISFSNSDGSFVAIEEPVYNCYNYRIEQSGSVREGAMRYCAFQRRTKTSVSLDAWDQQYASPNFYPNQWAPVTREWANLALFHSDLAAQSSTDGAYAASRAADGDWRSGGGTSVSRTQNEANPWWQIDLGSPQDITRLRIYSRDDACSISVCTPQADLRVFVSNTDLRTISADPAVLQGDPRVSSFVLSGGLGALTNVRALQANNAATRGRYVRVQRVGTGVLALSEVQVYGRNQVDPDRYPMEARDLTPNDGTFEVKVFNPRATGQDRYVWVLMRGNLEWQAPTTGPLANVKVGNGGGLVTWSLQRDYSTEYSNSTTTGNSYRVGAEFDVAAGFGAKVTAGGGYEFSSSLERTDTRTTATGSGLEIGGEIGGFPTTDRRPLACEYGFRPFKYTVTDQASSGYGHAYPVVDYLVPATLPNRTNDFSGCRANPSEPPPVEPNFGVNFTDGTQGSSFVLTAQNFPAGGRAVLSIIEPGASNFRPITELTTNGNGGLTFVLVTAETAPMGEYRVQISVDAPGGGVSTVTREVRFTLASSAPPRDQRPPNTPVVVVQPGGPAIVTRYVFLPMTVK